ncbi:ProQ/FINO family protein [Comamonas koreensis]|nr:ProQ/FINO family protein [Comamonas koreensis]
MTEPTLPTSSDASAPAPAAAAPAAGGDTRRQPKQERRERPAGQAPVLNSAMADALRAATKGHALEVAAAPAPVEADAAPVQRQARSERPARSGQTPRRSNKPGNGARREGQGAGGRGPRRDGGQATPAAPKAPPRPRHPVVEKLAGLYPALFGDQPLPLKRGVFQDLMAAHPDAFEKGELKVALGLHTRSTRYLNAVAMGQPRHDLQGQVVEAMAPEHVFHALVESFRRRKPRDGEDLQLKLRRRIGMAYIASDLSRDDFLAKVQVKDEATQAMLAAAMQEVAEFDAKAEALATAHAASGKSVAEFADMYGMHPAAVERHLHRAAQAKAIAARPAAAPAAPEAADEDEVAEPAAAKADDSAAAE